MSADPVGTPPAGAQARIELAEILLDLHAIGYVQGLREAAYGR